MADVDMLVIGAGPSGLTVAAEVARTGASVLVLEKRTVEPIPRAGTLLPRPLELFDARGIAERFIRRTCEVNPHPFQTWHIWAGMHPVDWTARDSRFGFTLFLAQHESETILRDWAAESGAELLFRHEVVGLVDEGDQVQVTSRDSAGALHTTTARFVIGADGGRSRTRELAGIEFPGHDATFTGVIATATMDFPWEGGLKVGHNERGWLTSFPFGPGLTRFTMVHADMRRMAQNEPVTVQELSKCVSEILEEPVPIPELAAATRYSDAQRMAASFQKGNIFLVGESARIHYPASGVGMNFCLQDAFNLGRKIGAVLAGHAGTELLNTYEAERRPIAEDLFNSVDAQVAIQFDFTPQGLAFIHHFEDHFITTPEVTAQLWAELNGLETPYPRPAHGHPSVGLPAPDVDLFLRDGSSLRLYEILRESPFVVLDLSGAGTLRNLEFENGLAMVLEVHPARRPEALHGIASMIIRPDTYVAWADEVAPDATKVRRELARALANPAERNPSSDSE